MEETLDLIYKDPKYPSSKVVNGLSMAGPRAHLRGMGLDNEDLSKPFIGVINTYNEMHPGHVHLDRLGKLVRDGVLEAGGIPFEVNTISICDGFSQGHVGMCSVLPSREIIADSIDVYAAGHQLDGLVLIGGCDKIVPAMLMAALRVNLPTVIVTGGPMMPAVYKGRTYATYELKEMAGKLTRGELSRQEYEYMEGLMSPTPGSCAMMGTANTMSVVAEALGLTLPGSACAHAVSGKQAAISHSLYSYFCTCRPEIRSRFLHGELVGASLVYQLAVNGAPQAEQEGLDRFLRRFALPACLEELGLADSPEERDSLFAFLAEHMPVTEPQELERLRTQAPLLFHGLN